MQADKIILMGIDSKDKIELFETMITACGKPIILTCFCTFVPAFLLIDLFQFSAGWRDLPV